MGAISEFVAWIKLKHFQFELSVATYLLGKNEKRILCTFIFRRLGRIFNVALFLYRISHRQSTFYIISTFTYMFNASVILPIDAASAFVSRRGLASLDAC
jgi:predicted permease